MKIKIFLRLIRKILPNLLLEKIQSLQSCLLSKWILHSGSQVIGLSHKPAMVFSPHQDDETFGCGGTIALKREHEIPVYVVFLTDGGQGFVDVDSHLEAKNVQTRKQEAVKALEVLGVEESSIHFLDKPDGKLQLLASEERQSTIQQVIQLLKIHQPGEVYVPHRKDCHKDHEATYEIVKEAIAQAKIDTELLQYPIWLFWEAPLFLKLKFHDIATASRLTITSVREKKQKAISAYTSQLEILPPAFVNLFLQSDEIFFTESDKS
ncbi:PIG-L deacetylase family protein [Calothrix rhizosoleniae]|uniref:PIG-L deacetylase family protein n=1 Tax=Calothrix rhizosoleniae TaxID=888997 RepID=UPI000B49DCA8|nr:PIG-L deacetylase family protein [Calothrix rhizosoleniae]